MNGFHFHRRRCPKPSDPAREGMAGTGRPWITSGSQRKGVFAGTKKTSRARASNWPLATNRPRAPVAASRCRRRTFPSSPSIMDEKYIILRRLRQHGFGVQVLPATATAGDALKHKPAGIFSVQRPGDPARSITLSREVKTLVGQAAFRFLGFVSPPDARAGVRRENLQIEISAIAARTSR